MNASFAASSRFRPRATGRGTRRSSLGCVTAVLALLVLAPGAAASSVSLLLPSSSAFTVLGHSCGGIQEQAFATGFAPTSGYPKGAVYLQTRCSNGGRGGGTTTYRAWVAVTWKFGGDVASYARLAGAPGGLSPTYSANGAYGDTVYNSLTAVNVAPANCAADNTTYCTYRAYFTAAVPAPPTKVTAVQNGDQFKVSWKPASLTGPVITSSTVTATPVNPSRPVLTASVSATATSALVGALEPQTTYQITVVNVDAGGTGPASRPISVTTPVSTVPPSAPTGVTAYWTAPQQPGDMLGASWQAPRGGDSPIDRYQVTVSPHDAQPPAPSPVTQSLSGSTLITAFQVDDSLDWSVQVRGHNAAGWGVWSSPIILLAS